MKTKLLKFVCVWQIYAGGIQLSLTWWLLQKPGTSEVQILALIQRIVLHPYNKKSWVEPISFFQPGPEIFFLLSFAPQKQLNKPDTFLKASILTKHCILWKLQCSEAFLTTLLKALWSVWRTLWGQCHFPKCSLWVWTSSKAVWNLAHYLKENV